MTFLSTPSARRATRGPADWGRLVSISIHALREEGDFLFGGLASGAKWNGKTAPEPGDGYGRSVRAYHGSTLAPVCQIDRKTNQVIHEYPSIAAASRATGLDDSAIGKVCKGKLPHAGGFLFRYIEQ